MIEDIFKAIFSGPITYRIFSIVLLFLFIVWLIVGLRIAQTPVTKEEKDKLAPRADIKLFLHPSLKNHYILMIQNTNSNSVPIIDFRITFFFPSEVTEIKQGPLLHSGVNKIDVQGLRIVTEKIIYEEQPIETSITKNFSLIIKKAKINGNDVNTNEVVFACSKWPEGSSFSGDIIIDYSKSLNIFKTPGKIGTYEGLYFYEIKGKKFSEKIFGNIPT